MATPVNEPMENGQARPKMVWAMRDIIDNQLETSDHRRIGRVADLHLAPLSDGSWEVTHLVCGPQALVGRIASRLRGLARRVFRDRFDFWIPMRQVCALGPTITLRHPAAVYRIGRSERWIARHLLRWIPGSGYDQMQAGAAALAERGQGGDPAASNDIGDTLAAANALYIGDLVDSRMVTASGKTIGRLVDVQVSPESPHRLIALDYGLLSWQERLGIASITKTPKRPNASKSIPWESVDRFERWIVYLKPGAVPHT